MAVRQLFHFYARLGDLLRSGAALRRTLEMLSGRSSSVQRRLAAAALAAIDRGDRFSAGLAAAGAAPLDVALLRMAEETGDLAEGCRQLAEYYEYRLKIQDLWLAGLSSPLLALLILLVALFGATTMVRGLDVALVRLGYLAALLAVLLGGVFVGRLLLGGAPPVRSAVHRLALSFPLFGSIALNLARARFFLALSQLVSSGQTYAESVAVAAGACGNAHLARRLRRRADALVGGGSLAAALAREPILDEDGHESLLVAEESGTTDAALLRLATRYRQDGQATLERRLPILARLLLIPLVVFVFAVGAIDLVWAMVQRIGGMLGEQVGELEMPKLRLPGR